MRIDPMTKILAFSDSLSVEKALELFDYFKARTNPAFGIGTRLTNNLGYTPLQIVIKMVRCNDQPVAKISDEVKKIVCDDLDYLAYVRHVFKLDKP
jgi:nicotinate phosphoribosyltransferase